MVVDLLLKRGLRKSRREGGEVVEGRGREVRGERERGNRELFIKITDELRSPSLNTIPFTDTLSIFQSHLPLTAQALILVHSSFVSFIVVIVSIPHMFSFVSVALNYLHSTSYYSPFSGGNRPKTRFQASAFGTSKVTFGLSSPFKPSFIEAIFRSSSIAPEKILAMCG